MTAPHDHLRNAIARVDAKRHATAVEEQDFDFITIISIDCAYPVQQGNAMSCRKS